MKIEKRIAKLKTDFMHLAGGVLIGISVIYLFSTRQADSPFSLFVNFAMFITLFLLGLSYLGE